MFTHSILGILITDFFAFQAKSTTSNSSNHFKKTSKISGRNVVSKSLEIKKSENVNKDKISIQFKQNSIFRSKNTFSVNGSSPNTGKHEKVPIISSNTPSNIHLSHIEAIKSPGSLRKGNHAVKIPSCKMQADSDRRTHSMDVKMNSKIDEMQLDADFENVLSSLLVADFTDESSFYSEYKDILESFLAK